MVFIVNAENRHLFEQDLLEMHRQRRQVFIEGLGWPLPTHADLECDRYDSENVVYLLIIHEASARLQASVRLLRTDRPHPLLDLFRELCEGEVPCGPGTWEISRFCTNPAVTSRRERLSLLWQIICGCLETALLFDMQRLTFVANKALRPLALECGWDAVRLGPTLPDRMTARPDDVTAIAVDVTREGLERVRDRFGVPGPLVRFHWPDRPPSRRTRSIRIAA